jgi:hypothetical protein
MCYVRFTISAERLETVEEEAIRMSDFVMNVVLISGCLFNIFKKVSSGL